MERNSKIISALCLTLAACTPGVTFITTDGGDVIAVEDAAKGNNADLEKSVDGGSTDGKIVAAVDLLTEDLTPAARTDLETGDLAHAGNVDLEMQHLGDLAHMANADLAHGNTVDDMAHSNPTPDMAKPKPDLSVPPDLTTVDPVQVCVDACGNNCPGPSCEFACSGILAHEYCYSDSVDYCNPCIAACHGATEIACPGNCSNGVTDGNESDRDCGGDVCAPCTQNGICNQPSDCLSGKCVNNACAGVELHGTCQKAIDCTSWHCSNNTCIAYFCDDGWQDGDETGVDCGPSCLACPPANCGDNLTNGDETDRDCGGSCNKKCAIGQGCKVYQDCSSHSCDLNTHTCSASCDDGLTDQDETDRDCGGSICTKCNIGQRCNNDTDCASGLCELYNFGTPQQYGACAVIPPPSPDMTTIRDMGTSPDLVTKADMTPVTIGTHVYAETSTTQLTACGNNVELYIWDQNGTAWPDFTKGKKGTSTLDVNFPTPQGNDLQMGMKCNGNWVTDWNNMSIGTTLEKYYGKLEVNSQDRLIHGARDCKWFVQVPVGDIEHRPTVNLVDQTDPCSITTCKVNADCFSGFCASGFCQ